MTTPARKPVPVTVLRGENSALYRLQRDELRLVIDRAITPTDTAQDGVQQPKAG